MGRRAAAALLILFGTWELAEASSITVRVRDASGGAVPGARISLRNSGSTVVASATADETGFSRIDGIACASYELRVEAPGFEDRHASVDPCMAGAEEVTVNLDAAILRTTITVTAERGTVQEVAETPVLAVVQRRNEMEAAPLATIGNALENSPGILVQQSTYGQVSPFLRGLTGYHVLNLIDGIRLNNTTFRSGPNQYLAFVDPSQVQRLEAALGPAGAEYGSDSLGGTIQVLTPDARFATKPGLETHGEVRTFGASADLSGGAEGILSFSTPGLFWLGGASGRRLNDLRAGGAVDSRNVFRRYFGLSTAEVQGLVGDRLQDTGFSQYGVHTKLAARLASDQALTIWYQRSGLDGVRGYKDLLGGLGRLRSVFEPQLLNFLYARYEKFNAGPLESVSGAFSWNSQHDGSIRQNLKFSDPLTADENVVNAYGLTSQATARLGRRQALVFGGEIYAERVASSRTVTDPVADTTRHTRPLYPNGSHYDTYAAFLQDTVTLFAGKVRAVVGGRLTAIRYQTFSGKNLDPAGASLGVANSSDQIADTTFHAALSWRINDVLGVHARVGRGFRAPNLNDLGALGLNDLGYEIPAADLAGTEALIGSSGGENATSIGKPVSRLKAESLYNYEIGLAARTSRFRGRVHLFDAEFYDPITRRMILFPEGQTPDSISGLPVTAIPPAPEQRAQGVLAVATGLDPRAVKSFVNDGRARYYGMDSYLEAGFSRSLTFELNYSYLLGRDLNPNRYIRRLRPQAGSVSLRFAPGVRNMWFQVVTAAAGRQDRLSGGDLGDERIGAARSRSDIAAFFGGDVAGQFIDSSGRFAPTGETLSEIQDRVLPLGQTVNQVVISDDRTRAPMFLETAGWVTVGFRMGMPLSERVAMDFAIDNLLDRNYRLHGSGVDMPGIHAYLGLRYSF